MKKRLLALVLLLAVIISVVPSINVNADELAENVANNNEIVEVEDMALSENEVVETESLDVKLEGKKVKVAILDTGVNETEYTKNRLLEGCNDDNGHGTVIGDIIASNTNENVELIPIKVFDKDGKADIDSLVKGLYEGMDKGADVINISASSEGYNEKLRDAIEEAHNKGIYVVVSAGNCADVTTKYMPSFSTDAIVVSATDKDGEFTFYSNYGRTVDYSANGTYSNGNVTYNGTSIAAARVSSYIALLLEQNRNVEQSLLNCKEDKGEEGFDNYYGNGYLCLDYIKSQLDCKDEVEQIGLQETEEKVDYNDYSESINDTVQVAGGWFNDYWMVSNWGDFLDGALNNGATKFVLMADVSISDLWVIDGGTHYTISGSGHQLVNNRPDKGPMILVRNGGVLTTENNLVLNGNNHRNSGSGNEGGSSCVDCINATYFANQTTFCNNWNYGYLPGNDNLGGGTGFNIVAENGTNSAYGKAVGCVAYNCDGAGFFVRNDDGRGATMECENCIAYDCSWSFMTNSGVMNLKGCISNASRHDSSKDKFGGPHGGCGICYTGGSGTASNCTSQGAFAAFWVNSNGTLNNCTGKDSPHGYFGIGGSANDSKFYNNEYGISNWGGVISLNRCKAYDNSTGICSYGVTNVDNCSVYNNVVGMSIEEFITQSNQTVNMNGGECKNNTWMDVYQNGTLCLSGNATNTSNAGIYLCSGRHISVVGNLSRTSNVTLAPESNSLGRKVVEAVFVECSSILSKFKLNAIKTTSGRDGILRCGVGTNGATNTIVLSEKYTVTYKANLNKIGVSETVPSVEYFYWKEEGTLKTGQRPVLTKNGNPYTGYSFVEWNTNKYGTDTSYSKNVKTTISNDLILYAIYVDDIIPTGGIYVYPTVWENTNGFVSITALDEGSGIDKIVLYEYDISRGTSKVVRTYYHYGTNSTVNDTYYQSREGEYIYYAYIYDVDGNVTTLVSQRMKIDKSEPEIHGLENTETDWTNIAPVINVNATDFIRGTTHTGSGVNKISIIDYKGKIVATGKDRCSFTLTDEYEGRREFTIEAIDNIGQTRIEKIVTKYDKTKPVIIGDESSAVDNSIYVSNNIINQACNDHYSNSRYANDSSGIKEVKLYAYKNGKLDEVKSNSTKMTFAKEDTNNTFTCKYKIKEEEKDVEFYYLVVTDFAGNVETRKITSQRYLLTLFRTSIDESSFV